MRRIKRTLKSILAALLVIAITGATPVFANNDYQNNEQQSDYNYWTEEIAGIPYYHESTIKYTITVGVYENVIDCSFIDKSMPDIVYSRIIPIADIELTAPVAPEELFKYAKEHILSNPELYSMDRIQLYFREEDNAETITMNCPTSDSTFITPNSLRSVATDKAAFINYLTNHGYPQEYPEQFITQHTLYGYQGKLYRSFYYYVSNLSSWSILATSTIGLIITITSLPESIILATVSLVVNGYGVLSAINDLTLKKYTITGNDTKHVRVEDLEALSLTHSYTWTGIIGDNGVYCTLTSETTPAYFNNHIYMIELGINNYINLMY